MNLMAMTNYLEFKFNYERHNLALRELRRKTLKLVLQNIFLNFNGFVKFLLYHDVIKELL